MYLKKLSWKWLTVYETTQQSRFDFEYFFIEERCFVIAAPCTPDPPQPGQFSQKKHRCWQSLSWVILESWQKPWPLQMRHAWISPPTTPLPRQVWQFLQNVHCCPGAFVWRILESWQNPFPSHLKHGCRNNGCCVLLPWELRLIIGFIFMFTVGFMSIIGFMFTAEFLFTIGFLLFIIPCILLVIIEWFLFPNIIEEFVNGLSLKI